MQTIHKDSWDYQFCDSGFPSRLPSFISPVQTAKPLTDITCSKPAWPSIFCGT